MLNLLLVFLQSEICGLINGCPIWKPPSTKALRAFEASARRLSFTDAAADLSLTQGAISHQIRELEQHLGVKLFDREARGITLTEDGRSYLPFVREALDRLRAGSDVLSQARQNWVLTVTMSPNFATKWLVPRLGIFAEAHPPSRSEN